MRKPAWLEHKLTGKWDKVSPWGVRPAEPYEFPAAAVRNPHNWGGLKLQKATHPVLEAGSPG